MKTNIIILLLMIVPGICMAQWPVENGSQGIVVGTVGEGRSVGAGGRLHNGTDCLNNGSSLTVYSVMDDQISRINMSYNNLHNSSNNIVMTSGIIYRHVNISSTIAANNNQINQINSGTRTVNLQKGAFFAEMVTGGTLGVHVHIENAANANYLENGFSAPAFDLVNNTSPQFGENANSDAVRIYKNLIGSAWDNPKRLNVLVTDEGLPAADRPVITYGDIDVVANVFMKGINNSGNPVNGYHLAPYRLGFSLTDTKNPAIPVFSENDKIVFRNGFDGVTVTPDSKATYRVVHSPQSGQSNPFFIVTNDFLLGVSKDSVIKTDQLKDGDYEVNVRAQGHVGTAGTPSLVTEKKLKLRIDNYKAYIQKVIVTDENSLVKYFAEWSELVRNGDGSIILKERNSEPFKSGTIVNMLVTTSEKIPSLVLNLPTGPDINMTPVGTDGLQWQAQFSMPSSNTKKVHVKFKSGKRIFSLQLNQDAADVKRDPATGKFADDNMNSVDKNHELRVCPSDYPLALQVDVQNGQTVTLSATGGTEPYEFSIDQMPIAPNHHSTFTSTTNYTIDYDKNYIFKVRDAGKCQAEKYYTLPKVECDALTTAGGEGTDIKQVNLGSIPGLVTIVYDMYSIPDQITVAYRGTSQTTGIVSGPGSLTVNHTIVPGQSNLLTITMFAPNPGTAWEYRVICPGIQTRYSSLVSSSEQNYDIHYSGNSINISSKYAKSDMLYKLMYREIGEKDWGVVSNVTLPYSIHNNGVDMQVKLIPQNETVQSPSKLSVFPNPSNGPVKIRYTSENEGDAYVSILNSQGSVIYKKQVHVLKGLNTINWTAAESVSGLLFIKIQQNDKTIGSKVLISH